MSDKIIPVFDRPLLAQRRARFAGGFGEHDFLLQRAGEDILARLQTVTRRFPLAVNLGAHHGTLTDMLRQNGQVERVISADPSLSVLKRCYGARVSCDEETLPFRTASLDLIASGLSLHLVNDVPGALIQIRHALKPDGLFLGAVLGGQTLHEMREAMSMAEEEICGGVSPRVAPFGDVRDFGALLQRAGFALPVTDSDVVRVTYETPFHLMRELRAMGASNMLSERRRVPATRGLLLRAAEIYTKRHGVESGRIQATFEIIHMTGWAPDASQPQPLRPGSAKTRLADALGTTEIRAGDKTGPTDKI